MKQLRSSMVHSISISILVIKLITSELQLCKILEPWFKDIIDCTSFLSNLFQGFFFFTAKIMPCFYLVFVLLKLLTINSHYVFFW